MNRERDLRLQRRLAQLIEIGTEFSANDLTASGDITLDPDHEPNAANNGIGTLFSQAHKAKLIAPVGVTRSTAPHRKGGMIRTWQPTEKGRLWAKSNLHHPT